MLFAGIRYKIDLASRKPLMKLKIANLLAGAAILALVCLASTAHASLSFWTIDPLQSSVSLKINDFRSTIDGLGDVVVRIRNQATDQNNAWNTGNTARISGTIETDYVDGTSIQFLANHESIYANNSGNYRPNPAAYTGDTNPDPGLAEGGFFSDTSQHRAVFGARVRVSALGGLINATGAFFSIYGLNYSLASGILPIAGNTFSANTMNVGLQDARLAVDGSTVFGTQVVDDRILSLDGLSSVNSAPAATIVNWFGLIRLTIPISLHLNIPLDDTGTFILPAVVTGQIVADRQVAIPEPSAFMLAVIGLAFVAWRKSPIARQRTDCAISRSA